MFSDYAEQIVSGYIIQPDGGKMAAVWHSKDGTRIKGPADENLVRFVRSAPRE